MFKKRHAFEWFILATIIVSLIVHIIDLHIVKDREAGKLVYLLSLLDIVIIGIFTFEYLYRWYKAPDRRRYPFSFMAIIDLIVILPFYMSYLLDLRSLRLLRTIRMMQLLKIYRYNRAMQSFLSTIRKVMPQLEIIGLVLLVVVTVSSTAMYELERDSQPERFNNLSDAVWWCVVTLSTVGYGDITPSTQMGRLVAGITIVIGMGIFGTFISLIGGAFITSMQDEEQQALSLSKPVYRMLRMWQKDKGEPFDMESLRHHADHAVEAYIARNKQLQEQVE